ncbi:MAG: peptidoglycan recognition protein family protein [Oscillospiraceae bacterium]|jgi:N-acetylmuramoyl-L-alanine amidase|nr:peptidoglycan recognition protein family protein [Oscillospiraceae bacterium]
MGATVIDIAPHSDGRSRINISYNGISQNLTINSGFIDDSVLNSKFGWTNPVTAVFEALGSGIILRDSWGAVDLSHLWERDYTKNTIVFHHTANNRSVKSIDNSHNSRRQPFDGIGYHFIIDAKGNIYEGRPLEMKGAHIMPNTGRIGIALIGNFEKSNPTTAQMQSTLLLTGILTTYYTIDNIGGHRDLATGTVCPGDNFYSTLWRFL